MEETVQSTPAKQKIISKALFKDRLLISLIAAGLVAAVVTSIKVILSTRSYDIDIPIRYTQFGAVDSYITGDWFNHYNFVIFSFLILIINTLVALRFYQHRRWVSIGVLSMQLFVFIYLFVIIGAIINTLPVAA